ncbi:MAG: FAD-dependent oxidoreductase [Deltaproteobacteria bacterium]|nr:FAD-dependent oxidoreductase [Deltaproteobacteria bacterium]
MLDTVFSPIKIGTVEIPNRLVVPAMVMNYCNLDGTATERYIAYHEAKARGGWGLIITEDYAVDPKGRGFPNIPGLWDDSQIEGHAELTRRVHDIGGTIFAQIYHCGRQTSSRLTGSQPVAPSPIPCPLIQETPHELTTAEIKGIVEAFGDCALRTRQAGFDGIEVHGGHGYLIAQFMSLYSNKRIDEYGGSLMNRLRFPLEILANIRLKAGSDFPVMFRISGDELVPGGRTIEDTRAIAVVLEEDGIDAIHVSAGTYGSAYAIAPPAAVGHGWITGYAQEVRKVVGIPVVTVGRITDPLLAEAIIDGGKADLVAMGRASLADPDLPNKAAAGRCEDINYCIGCMQGCMGMISLYQPATCLVNPALGREEEMEIRPAKVKKKVFVAGAGPAGMEAAMVAAKRGHEVHLFEKEGRLGGQYYLAAVPPAKGEITSFIVWLKKQLDDHTVAIYLETELTEEIVSREKPDVVVIATGSTPAPLNVPGLKGHVVTAHDVLEGKVDVGRSVAIIGGGMIGAETANHLAHHGKKVTIVEMLPAVAQDEQEHVRLFLLKELAEKDVTIYVNTTITAAKDGSLVIERDGKRETIGPFDTVVTAVGLQPCNKLQSRLEGKVDRLLTIGDAAGVRKALDAIAEGYKIGLEI